MYLSIIQKSFLVPFLCWDRFFLFSICWKGSLWQEAVPSKDENVAREKFERAHRDRNDKYEGPEVSMP